MADSSNPNKANTPAEYRPDVSNSGTQKSQRIELIAARKTSIALQKEAVESLVSFVKKRLPNLSDDAALKLTNFLISAPAFPIASDRTLAEIQQINYRGTDARDIAAKLITAGFGSARNGKPLEATQGTVINLATLLMAAPPAAETIAERSFKREFAEWKGKFATALQGIQSQENGGRSR